MRAADAGRYAASVVGARLESEVVITAQKYRNLIESYLNYAIDVNELMARFDAYFYGEDENLPKDLFLILNDTFEALECYMPDTPPEQETDTRISETTLRSELAEICRRLDGYMKEASKQPAA
ncbi:MAG TPA: colicin immunity domain-containing protein [Pyrinomonadaceae bacterium]